MSRRIKVGNIGVDSGRIVLIDPFYLDEIVRAGPALGEGQLTAPTHDGKGTFDVGVVVPSGYGDGVYAVYADIEYDDSFHGDIVRRIIVEFT